MIRFLKHFIRCLLTCISPTINTKFNYYQAYKKKLDLSNPVTLDEKILWLKLNTYYKNPIVRNCVDKFAVREYVEKRGCGEILNTLYEVWDDVDEIPWNNLPEQFVIKWNCACGQNLIVRDKKKLDIQESIKTLHKWKNESRFYYLTYSEMQYKGIKPKLICEKLIDTKTHKLPTDYKVYCFNGKAKYVMICTDRNNRKANYFFFDRNNNFCKFDYSSLNYPDDYSVTFPKGYQKLFYYAEKLAKGFPFVRIDFYVEDGKVIFGEFTFTPCAGMDSDILPEKNIFLGSLLTL